MSTSSKYSYWFCAALLINGLLACETTAPPEDGRAEAGESAGDVAGESAGIEGGSAAGSEGGVEAGEESAGSEAGEIAGDRAGFEIIAAGEETAGMPNIPTFDPNSDLPTPMATTLSPPESVSAPGEGEVDESCGGHYINEVRGWVVDEVGAPMSGARVQLCTRSYDTGALTCLMPKKTNSEGFYSVPVSQSARCMSSAAIRALVPRVAFAPIYCHGSFEDESADGVLRITEPLVLYQTRPALEVSEPDVEGARHSVNLPGELTIELVADDLYGPTVDELGGRSLSPNDPGLCFLDHSEEAPQVDGIYAFAPEGDITGSVATVSMPNSPGYEPGTAVQLYVLGNLDCSIEGMTEPLEEGEWTPVGAATVDEAGMVITSDDMSGIPCLSWFGFGPMAQ